MPCKQSFITAFLQFGYLIYEKVWHNFHSRKKIWVPSKKRSWKNYRKNLIFFSYNLSQGKRIELRDFGAFTIKKRAERVGRNPSTGEKIEIKKKVFIHFNPGKNLKKKLNEK